MIRAMLIGLVSALGALAPVPSDAQGFPSRPVRLIVPYAPGGAPDLMARLIAQPFQEFTGQPLVVDNRPGAGALIGAEAVARATPDGYTLLLVDGSLYSINPNLSDKFPYDILRDFTPITLAIDTAILLVVSGSGPIRNLADYLESARAKPGLPYCSSGQGTAHHLAMELVAHLGKVQLTHVPFRGAGQSVPAVVAGDVSATFAGPTAVMPHVKAGKLRVLGMTSARRSALIPDIPTLAEAGLPGYEIRNNMGILGPPKLAPEIVQRLNTEFVKTLQVPEVKKRLGDVAMEVVGSSAAEFAETIRTDSQYYARIIKAAGIKGQ